MEYQTGGTPSFLHKLRRIYSRLTPKGKIVFGVIGLIVFYFLLPSWSSSSSKNVIDISDDNLVSNNNDITRISSNEFHTLSDLLNNSPQVSKVNLNYLSLPPFLDSSNKFPHYKNGGNMLLSRNSDYVRLTKDIPRQNGNLFSHSTISTEDLSAIEIEVDFKIHGEQLKSSMIGDGMAIWLTTEQLKSGDVFGMQSDFNGLGFFLDTYKNYNGKRNRHAFPYLSIQRNKGIFNYYEKLKDGLETQLGGCALHRIYNTDKSNNPSKLKITYIRQANILEIIADVEGTNDWRTCFRKENVEVDELFPIGRPLYLGVSAETGELHHNVDLYSINVKTFRNKDGTEISEIDSLGQGIEVYDTDEYINKYDNNDNNGMVNRRRQARKSLNRLRRQEKKLKEADKAKYNSEHGFVGWFFGLVWKFIKMIFYLVLILLACYAVVIGYRVYKQKQRKNNRNGLL